MKDIDTIINEVNGTMAIEGMPITDEDKARIRACLRDSEKYDATLAALILKHTVPAAGKNA